MTASTIFWPLSCNSTPVVFVQRLRLNEYTLLSLDTVSSADQLSSSKSLPAHVTFGHNRGNLWLWIRWGSCWWGVVPFSSARSWFTCGVEDVEMDKGGSDLLLPLLLLLLSFCASCSWCNCKDAMAISISYMIGNSLGGWLERNISKSERVFWVKS